MKETVFFLNMFPDYEPPETLQSVLSQAAIVAADIDPDTRSVEVAIHSQKYIPLHDLQSVSDDLRKSYGLRNLQIVATHPADQLHCVTPDELMGMFVAHNSMNRGALAGAQWNWEGAFSSHEKTGLSPDVSTVVLVSGVPATKVT